MNEKQLDKEIWELVGKLFTMADKRAYELPAREYATAFVRQWIKETYEPLKGKS